MKRPTVLIGMLAVLLAALTGWLSREPDTGAAPRLPPPSVADYYLNGVQATSMGPDGLPRRRLSAQRMAHFPRDDRVELSAPQLELYGAGTLQWRIQASRGTVRDQGRRLTLSDGVQMQRQDASALSLRTDHLNILPNQHLARTDAPIRLTREHPRARLDAVGMEVHTDQGALLLKSQVRGSYEPTQP